MTTISEINQLYYNQKKTSKNVDFISENQQRMYINLHMPIDKGTQDMVKESIYTLFGIQKENIRISDNYIEILGFNKRFQKEEMKDIKQIVDKLSEVD
ncbi:MAG: hypothetical protein WCL02_00845 [bacterium]